jgi:outer membrane cobalamin receptor
MRYLLATLLSLLAHAQTGGTLHVTILDPLRQPIPQIELTLTNQAQDWSATATTNAQGIATFRNLAWQRYHVQTTLDTFQPLNTPIAIQSNIPANLTSTLQPKAQTESLTVVDSPNPTAIAPDQTGSVAQMSRDLIDRLAKSGGSRGLEQVIVTFPGFAQNANGTIHPRGAHNQMTFVIDGMPISDQLGGAFASAIDPTIVDNVQLYTGNIPAEFGNKVSAVAQVTTRSGYGTGRKFNGSLLSQVGQFDTLSQTFQASGESGKLAWSAMALGMKTQRYLDSVSLDNLHNGGNSQRAFLRLDYIANARDTFRLLAMGGRASFESANLRSQHAAGMRQRQYLEDTSFSGTWLRVLSATRTLETNVSCRPTAAALNPSAGDTPVTAEQYRTLRTLNANARYSHLHANHNFRLGLDHQSFPVTERFRFAVTDPNFDPNLAPFTLPLGGQYFQFQERRTGTLQAAFLQDQIRLGRLTLNLGLRYDSYRFLARGAQWQPRLGLAYHIKETNTVLRASFNRLYQTPPNENLLLSSSAAAAALAPPIVRQTFGASPIQLRPERQNFYELGFQQAVNSWITLHGAYYHKDATDQQDNNNFFNTGIIFPITLSRIRVNGAEGRIEMRQRHGFSANVSFTHARAVSTPPFTGGLFIGDEAVDALSAGPFLIDHDQTLSIHSVVSYQNRRGWFTNVSTRYDSGLVANPSDPSEVAADPDFADLLPYVELNQTPARVTPRTITDVVLGYRRQSSDTTRWEAAIQATNITNQTALYNFQSVFVGTRVVQPRTLALRFRLWF